LLCGLFCSCGEWGLLSSCGTQLLVSGVSLAGKNGFYGVLLLLHFPLKFKQFFFPSPLDSCLLDKIYMTILHLGNEEQTLTKTQTCAPIQTQRHRNNLTGLPAGPVVKNSPASARSAPSIPGQGTTVPQDTEQLSWRGAAIEVPLLWSPCATVHVRQRRRKLPRAATKTQRSQTNTYIKKKKKSKDEGRRYKRGLRREEEVS